jgi:HTH-type transcriptional regulator / antitoxin HigA
MLNITRTINVWQEHARDLSITRPTNQAEYEQLLGLIERVLERQETSNGNLETHPLTPLLDLAMHYADEWEEQHAPIVVTTTPRDALEFWMDQQGVNQSDLERAGIAKQPDISRILKGERSISKGMAKRLGAFFRVSPAEFL